MRSSLRRPRVQFLSVAACAAIALVSSVTVAAAAPAGTARPDAETVAGTLVRTWSDHEEPGEAAAHREEGPLSWVQPADGDAVRVVTEDVDDLTVGDTVEVVLGDEVEDHAGAEGMPPAREVLASEVLEAAPPAPEPPTAPATYPYHEVTVVMVVPPGGAPDNVTLADVVAQVNGPVADFWAEETNGDLAISVVAQHDWMTTTADCTDPLALWEEVAEAVDFDPMIGDGDHLLVYVSSAPSASECAYGSGATFGAVNSGGLAYVRDLSTSLIAHEFGHMFGLDHSAGTQCTASGFTGDCYSDEYGDLYDVMGYSWEQLGSLNVVQAQRITWGVNQVPFAMGYADRTVTLSPVSQASGYHTVNIDAGGRRFWLEYRPPSGRDAWLGTADNTFGLQPGVLLRQRWGDGSTLVDPTPSPQDGWQDDLDVAMPIGTPVEIAGGSYSPGIFTVTVQSTSPTEAVVTLSAEPGDDAYDERCEGWARPNAPSSGVSLLGAGAQASALAIGTERGLWERPVDGGAGSWRSLGGVSLYGPAGAVAGSTAYAFVVGTDQSLWYRSNGGSGWGPWQSLGGRLTASPAAASLGSGHVRVFGRGAAGELWSRELRSGTWSGWMPHGGVLSAPPTASADPVTGLVRATVRGLDGSLFDLLFPEGGRTASYQVRGIVTCSSLALTAVESVHDYGDGAYLDGRGQPRVLDLLVARGLGGTLTSNPAVAFTATDFLVAGRGTDGALWVYDGRAGTDRWISLGGRVI